MRHKIYATKSFGKFNEYIPKEYRELIDNVYNGTKQWNEITKRWNVPVVVEWKNGEESYFGNAAHMKHQLREMYSPEDFV